jgi:quinolinate synthase
MYSNFSKSLTIKDIHYSPDRIALLEEKIKKIRTLKKEKDAIILSHYYMPPELQVLHNEGGIADYSGDSLGLSIQASKAEASHIIFCGVRFMAETAAILNPERKVFIPEMQAGCSLAESINAEDVRQLKQKHPGVPVVAYVNTYAETKAESDYCCTSRNALAIAKHIDASKIIFIPDYYMGRNLKSRIEKETGKEMILWSGKCEVHEQFTSESLKMIAMENPDAEVLLHWEVPDDSVRTFIKSGKGTVGSTTDLIEYAQKSKSQKFIVGSECDLGAVLKGMMPEKSFYSPCIICPHMKAVDIENTLAALEAINTAAEAKYHVQVDPKISEKARIPLERMIALS